MEMDFFNDEYWMRFAIKEAEKAYQKEEVPIGAIVVWNNEIIGKGHNLTEHLQDPTAHAEMLAITAAANFLGSRRLNECTIYTTLEPCPMCAGALVMARVKRLVFATRDPKAGAIRSLYQIGDDPRLNHRMEITEGILETESSRLLTSFFKRLREKKNGKNI